ncbi:glycosyltransferase [Candidatus Woesearchaeota archaeon]|nr:glycosyltransferase [Candidatus Woesearchaeota archaeon]
MAKMNILVTATTFPRWKDDTEPSFVFVLSRLLSIHGYNVTVLVPHSYGSKKYELMDNLKVYRFPYFVPYRMQRVCYQGGILENLKRYKLAVLQLPLLFAFEFLNMARLIKKEKIDAIHAHWIVPQGFLAYLCKKLYGIPYIATAHAGDVFPLKSKFFRFLSNLAIKDSDFCTANSSFTKKKLLKISGRKDIKIIPMGVDLSVFSERNKNEDLRKRLGVKKEFILTVGRLVEKKGIKYLISSMKDVIKKFPDAKLVIIGDGPERKGLEILAKDLKLDGSIIFAGSVENRHLPEFYATADLFVGPSIVTESGDTEGLGIVFLEALASGTCVIGSNVGGIPDIIKHNDTGLLVNQKSPGQLANAIIRLLSDKGLRRRLASSGRKMVKEVYSWRLIGKRFNELAASIK